MEIMTFGLKVTALGFGTVFVALYSLSLLIDIQSKLLAPKPKKVAEPKVQDTPKPVEEKVSVSKQEDDEDEIAAVIAAAVMACGHKAVIKNIKRITGTSGSTWSATGRVEAMNLRQIF